MSVEDFIDFFFFFLSRRRHTRFSRDWSSDVCSSDLSTAAPPRCPAVRARASAFSSTTPPRDADRKSVVEGKSVYLGGRRIIRKKKRGGNKILCQGKSDVDDDTAGSSTLQDD